MCELLPRRGSLLADEIRRQLSTGALALSIPSAALGWRAWGEPAAPVSSRAPICVAMKRVVAGKTGVLLLPRDALVHIRRQGSSDEEVVAEYGASKRMYTYRVSMTGVDRQFRGSNLRNQN